MGIRLDWIRKTHNFLGIFFAPLLLLFVATGWWQTMGYGDSDDDEGGSFSLLMSRLSRVHTDSYYPPQVPGSHSPEIFKILVGALCLALLASILTGLFLAWKTNRRKAPVLLAFVLGILIPIVILAFK